MNGLERVFSCFIVSELKLPFSISAALAPHFVVEPIIKINYALKDVREDRSQFWFH